ncbi:MAG: ATP-binding protein [Desulfobacterales bacterium]|nr:ATP-binding protein [Desulfobacterales bacterium]
MNGIIEDANPAFLDILGYDLPEVVMKAYHEFSPEKWRAMEEGTVSEQVLQNGVSDEFEKEFIRKNGSLIPAKTRTWLLYDRHSAPAGKMILISDISFQKELESQLRQSQKLEAVGTLAGGIAHDFNNILSSIMGYLELLKYDLSKKSPARKHLEPLFKASYRARDLVRHILDFSRQSDSIPQVIPMQYMIKEVVELMSATLPSTIQIKQDIEKTGLAVKADQTQVHQVLMNLCTNAYHAMKETGGILEISLKQRELSGQACIGYYDLRPGRYLELAVSDTGAGMDEETMKRAFDPYFTTKEKGEGTGMGLAVVHGIVKKYRGSIRVDSRPGDGTTFKLLFPVCEKNAGHEADKGEKIPTGCESILFVDDEKEILNSNGKLLEKLGYKVTSRSNGRNALTTFRQNPAGFDILITDMTMPEMTGEQLARRVKSISPLTPVIMCTGSSRLGSLSGTRTQPPNSDYLLFKPVDLRRMAGTVRKALDKTGKHTICPERCVS